MGARVDGGRRGVESARTAGGKNGMGSEARWGRSGGGDCFLGLHEAERVGTGDQARAMRREALVEASWTSGAELVLTGWARAMRGQMMMGSATGKRKRKRGQAKQRDDSPMGH